MTPRNDIIKDIIDKSKYMQQTGATTLGFISSKGPAHERISKLLPLFLLYLFINKNNRIVAYYEYVRMVQ